MAKTKKKSKTQNKTQKKTQSKSQGKSQIRATIASTADKYALYQASVQEPEHEIEFFDKAFKQFFKRKPKVLREDFCGTHAVCCEWVKKRGRTAVGVDLDPEPLAWGQEHNQGKLKPKQREAITLLEDDVRSEYEVKADVLAAQNFSFWYFKTRDAVREYFEYALSNIGDEGLLVMDMMGGPECIEEDHEDERKYKGVVKGGFKYIWEQARFDPITHDSDFYISFRFKDGSALERAFHYHWRFWTIPEVRELLEEAGFSETHVYWEQEDEDGDGNDDYQIQKSAASDPSWIAYLVGVKKPR